MVAVDVERVQRAQALHAEVDQRARVAGQRLAEADRAELAVAVAVLQVVAHLVW